MAPRASKTEKKLTLKQSAQLAQGQSYPSLIQSKGFKVLLHHAMPTLDKGSIHRMHVSQLKAALNFHDYRELRVVMEALPSVKLNWELMGHKDVQWGTSSLIAGCRMLKDGTFEYSFDPIVVSELKHPTRFRIYDLEKMLGFSSGYALKIYELAFLYYDESKKFGRTPSMQRESLRELFNVQDGLYSRWYDFFKYVITSPLNEANERAAGEIIIEFKHDEGKPRARKYWFQMVVDPQMHVFKPLQPPDHPAAQKSIPASPVMEKFLSLDSETKNQIWEGIEASEYKLWFPERKIPDISSGSTLTIFKVCLREQLESRGLFT